MEGVQAMSLVWQSIWGSNRERAGSGCPILLAVTVKFDGVISWIQLIAFRLQLQFFTPVLLSQVAKTRTWWWMVV